MLDISRSRHSSSDLISTQQSSHDLESKCKDQICASSNLILENASQSYIQKNAKNHPVGVKTRVFPNGCGEINMYTKFFRKKYVMVKLCERKLC